MLRETVGLGRSSRLDRPYGEGRDESEDASRSRLRQASDLFSQTFPLFDVEFLDRSLCEFETGDIAECREILEATSGSSPIVHSRSSHTEERADLEHLSRPPWDPWQMLQASQRQLLLAIASVDSNKRIRTVPSLEEDSEEPFPLEDDEEQESRKEKRTRW